MISRSRTASSAICEVSIVRAGMMSCILNSRSKVFYAIVLRLPEANPVQAVLAQARRKLAPASHDNVLRGGDHAIQKVHVEIQVGVIQLGDDRLANDVAQVAQVDDHS